VPSRGPRGDLPALEDRRCAHCGYQPETSRTELDERTRRNRRRLLEAEAPEELARLDTAFGPEPEAKLPGPVGLAIGWFPADQWSEVSRRWPDLLDDLPADHLAYSHATEARIKRIARHTSGSRLHAAAMTVDGLQAHAEERVRPRQRRGSLVVRRHARPGRRRGRVASWTERALLVRIGAQVQEVLRSGPRGR
jgi:hypothetical protein